jgi:4-nitrophenyl phosphatase
LKKLVILDLDGTVYRGSEPVEHAVEVVHELIKQGREVRYLTNNSAALPGQTTRKLLGMGIPCRPEWVYGSGQAAARWCRESDFKRVYVVGEPGLREAFEREGFSDDTHPQAVVVGICRSFTYDIMRHAMHAIKNGAKFVATNLDPSFPVERGVFDPGAGSIVSSIQTCSGVTPTVIGKPEAKMVEQILSDARLKAEDAIVVGDRLDTDIECAHRAGCDSLLVMTGVETRVPMGQGYSDDLRGVLNL